MAAKQDERCESCITTISSNEMEDDKLTITMRAEAPAHYTLEIESFSWLLQILSKTGLDRYESNEFEASGYKWRMILYPEGDKKRNGGAHISLYMRIVDTQNLGGAWEVDSLLNFFVLDQSKNQYISIQDGRVKRFNAVNKEWGLSRLLPLTEFNDTSRGYLHEGRCKFGVEVFVLKNKGQGECFSIQENDSKFDHSWNFGFFSTLSKAGHYSDEFSLGEFKWKLHLYPRGVQKAKGEFLSVFLCLQDPQKLPFGSKMHVEFKLRVVIDSYDERNRKEAEKRGNAWFSAFDNAWGFPYLMKLADPTQTKDFVVVVEAEISSMSMTMTKDLFPDPPETTE